VNVPGTLLLATDDGRRIYTVESEWSDRSDPHASIHALDVSGQTATLRASVALSGWVSGAVVHGGHAYVGASSGDAYSKLATVDLAAMVLRSEQALDRGWAWPLGAAGSRLLLSTSWPKGGVLVYDLADPARPKLARFAPVHGWAAWKFVADAERAWVPGGPYGVTVVPLAP
jgi:hypothetical protein